MSFETSMGVLSLSGEGTITEVKPVMGDKRRLLKLLQGMQDGDGGVNTEGIDKVIDFITGIVVRDNPDVAKEKIGFWVEANFNDLLEQIMVGFKLTDQSKLDEAKKKV